MGVRVWEAGESDRRLVTRRIGIAGSLQHHPARKGADFRLVFEMAGAASGSEVIWHGIDWAKAHRTVKRLQARIAKAVRERRWNKVKALQWLS